MDPENVAADEARRVAVLETEAELERARRRDAGVVARMETAS